MSHDKLIDNIRMLIKAGMEIHAMKLYRDETSSPLKEAKIFVEAIKAEMESDYSTVQNVREVFHIQTSSNRVSESKNVSDEAIKAISSIFGPWAYLADPLMYVCAKPQCLN